MSLYIFVCILSLAGKPLLSRGRYHRRLFLTVVGVACWLMSALRYVIGFDYRFYETVFGLLADTGISSLFEITWIEPGYQLLNLAVSYLGGDYLVFLFVFHFIFLLLVFVWIDRWSPAPWLSVYLFVTLQYFAFSMNFMRQALAAAIILWTYPFIKSRRVLPCLGMIFLAAAFHFSALIMLPLCFLFMRKPSRLHYRSVILAAAAVYIFMDDAVEFALQFLPKYQHYLTEKYWQGNSVLYILLPLGCFLFTLPLLRQTRKDSGSSPVLANSMFYSLIMQMFITKHFILERFSIYAAFFSLLALPEAASAPSRISENVRTGILIAGCFVYFLFAASQGFHGVYPYRGIWDKALPL